MKFLLSLLFVVVLVTPFSAKAEVDPAKITVIKELMVLTKFGQISEMMATQTAKATVEAMKQQQPPVDPKVIAVVQDEVQLFLKEELAKDTFSQMIYPIYDKHFTTQELTDLVAFYKTPLGAKVLQELPVLTQEAMIVGQQWGQSLVPAMQARLTERLQKENLLPQ